MERRRFIGLAGSVATVSLLAGCSGEGSETPSEEANTGESTTAATTEAGTTVESTTTETTTTESTETATTSESSSGSFSQTFSGSGTSTSEEFELSPGPILAEFTHDGSSNFIVDLVTLDGESYQDVNISNQIGSVDSSQAASVSADGGYKLNVDADGEWEIALEQPSDPDPQSLPIDDSGEGATYLGPYEFSGPTTIAGSHQGSSNFIVEPIPVDPSKMMTSVFNEIGEFEGETTARIDGVAYLNVLADGEWTLQTSE